MNEIKIKTKWQDTQGGKGEKGLIHTVLTVDKGIVTTWSEPSSSEGIGGYSWRGTGDAFLRRFRANA